MKRTAAVGAAGAAFMSLAAWTVQSTAAERKANMNLDLRQTAEHVVDQAPAGPPRKTGRRCGRPGRRETCPA